MRKKRRARMARMERRIGLQAQAWVKVMESEMSLKRLRMTSSWKACRMRRKMASRNLRRCHKRVKKTRPEKSALIWMPRLSHNLRMKRRSNKRMASRTKKTKSWTGKRVTWISTKGANLMRNCGTAMRMMRAKTPSRTKRTRRRRTRMARKTLKPTVPKARARQTTWQKRRRRSRRRRRKTSQRSLRRMASSRKDESLPRMKVLWSSLQDVIQKSRSRSLMFTCSHPHLQKDRAMASRARTTRIWSSTLRT
mmetsp:Transcript_16628/g.38924  ORF Transcript_16628/g.38924 Transcript_16628/m.38924 type:complete len:251 (+) Transcript_16628:745-1497(+)